MPTVKDNKVVFQGGEALPDVNSSAYLAAQNGEYNPVNLYSGYNTPPIDNNNVITKESLQSQTPVKVSAPSPALKNDYLQASIESGVNSSMKDIAEQQRMALENSKIEAQKKTVEDKKQTWLSSLIGNKGKSQLQADEYSKTNSLGTTVNDTAAAVKKANQEILDEQYANRKAIERLDKNPQGLFGGALEQEKNRLIKESTSKQADLYIKKLALQGDYETAKNIADQAVNAKYEQSQNELEAEKLDYLDSKELYTKSEQRQYEALLDEKKRNLDKQKEDDKRLQDTNIALLQSANEQGAPQAIKDAIARATTVEEKINAAGIYAGDILEREIKRAQIEKIYADAKDKDASNSAIYRVSAVDLNSPNYILDLLEASSGGGKLTGDQTKPISKAMTVVGQIDSLTDTLSKTDTGPILGILKSANPYDVKASLVKAQLQAIIPNLARGVYGEVGVLTDADIENYTKTLGNLRKPSEINDLLTAMTLKTIKNGIDDQLEVFASAGRDVSGFKNLYTRLNDKISSIENKIGVGGTSGDSSEGAIKEYDGVTYKVINGVWTPQ